MRRAPAVNVDNLARDVGGIIEQEPTQHEKRTCTDVDHLAAELAVHPAAMRDEIHRTQKNERKYKSEGESDVVIQRKTPE